MNRQEWKDRNRAWAREHAEDIVACIQGYKGGYIELFCDFSGVIRDDDDSDVGGFGTPQELVEELNRINRR